MKRNGWHIIRDSESLTVSRRVPVLWDVAARTLLPNLRKSRLAHQVRQDVWRALRHQRGFAPAVEVRSLGDGVCVTAGGRVEAGHDRAALESRIAGLLADAPTRARWIACAGGGR